jgi:hypothetical protein
MDNLEEICEVLGINKSLGLCSLYLLILIKN